MKSAYLIQHKRVVEIDVETGEKIHSTCLLGFFSSREKCEELISLYTQLEGFRDYPDDFIIEEVEADIDDFNDEPGEFGSYVYYLSHEWYDGEYDHITDFGYYSTGERAEKAKQQYGLEPEFAEYPEGFCITE